MERDRSETATRFYPRVLILLTRFFFAYLARTFQSYSSQELLIALCLSCFFKVSVASSPAASLQSPMFEIWRNRAKTLVYLRKRGKTAHTQAFRSSLSWATTPP
jgi:hypothetical protein